MELFKAIENRFSCRNYIDKKIKEDYIFKILDAGTKAPNSGNLQCWRFIVVHDEDKKEGLVKAALNQRWMMQAPVFIVVCGDLNYMRRFYKNKSEEYIIQDCSAAVENMLLSATALNIKSCWVGAIDKNAVQRVLKMPSDIVPYVIIPLGYSNEKPEKKKRHSLESVVYFNEFGNKDDEKGLFPIMKYIKK